MDNMDFSKNKNFYAPKDTIISEYATHRMGENMIYIIKGCFQKNIKNTYNQKLYQTTQFKKGQRTRIYIYPKKIFK